MKTTRLASECRRCHGYLRHLCLLKPRIASGQSLNDGGGPKVEDAYKMALARPQKVHVTNFHNYFPMFAKKKSITHCFLELVRRSGALRS